MDNYQNVDASRRAPVIAAELARLKVGDLVTYTADGGAHVLVEVQRTFHKDPGGFGSSDHGKVTVGFGPGRWNTEVSAVGLKDGRYSLGVRR